MMQNLNEQQKDAVLHNQGSLLVVAGAGSGKTRVITTRIAKIKQDSPGSSIVALTFTNKAAKEMKERLERSDINTSNVFIGTFHGYALVLLKKYGSLINIDNVNIIDAQDQLSIVNKIIKKIPSSSKLNAKNILYQISELKNNIDTKFNAWQNSSYDLEAIYKAYETEKRNSKCLDFDDLIIKSVKLFENNEFKDFYQRSVDHILIDEYQDTNKIQHHLIKLMSLKNNSNELAVKSLCAVGDDDQSIYSWRGATVSNMLDFVDDFVNTTKIRIEQNYRSTQQILTIANELIRNNSFRNEKNLWSAKETKRSVYKFRCMTSHQEASVSTLILDDIKKRSPGSSIAILYRTHAQSRVLEETLLRSNITYKIIGGIQFYERKEIKDLIAYLKIVANPYDKISLARILNCPARKLGLKFEATLMELWDKESFYCIKQIAQDLISKNLVTGLKKKSFEDFINTITKFKPTDNISLVLNTIINEVAYIDYIKENFEPNEAQQKIENIQEFIRSARYSEEQGSVSLQQFLNDIALMQEKLHEQNTEPETVQLMTIHAAKGLEFDSVIITGLEEGTIPSSRSLMNNEAIEEERRLLYVAITRAKNELYLLNCTYRNSYGQTVSLLPSRFLDELPQYLIKDYDCAIMSNYEIADLLSSSVIKSKTNQKVEKKTPSIKTEWRINRSVEHASFGVGLIKKIDERTDGTKIITVQFKCETKKIASQFLKLI